MTAKLKLTKEQIEEAYSGDRSIGEAAKILGCSEGPLTRLMREYGIPAKSRGRVGRWQSSVPQLNDRDWLYEQIVVKGRGQRELAADIGTTAGNVAHYVRKHKLYAQVTQPEATKAWLARKFPNGRRGPDAANWRGGRTETGSGYVRIWKPDHPHANPSGYVYEHRLVMEEKIGRLLDRKEVVDHIDCNRRNNAPENLRLHATRADHVKDHFRARLEMNEMRDDLTERVRKLEAEIAALRAKIP